MNKTEKKIALFIPDFSSGGAERVTINLANGISDYGREVDLIAINAKGEFKTSISPRVTIVDLGRSRAATSIISLRKYLSSNRPAVLISALTHANLVAIVANRIPKPCTRSIVTLHSTYSQVNVDRSSFKWRLMEKLASMLYPLADTVVGVSHGVTNDAIKHLGISRARTRVIYNPIFDDSLLQRVGILKKQISRDPEKIVALGRLTPEKDFSTLIQAITLVSEHRNVTLKILGEGPLRSRLENEIEEAGMQSRIKLPGFSSDIWPELVSSTLFVLSSTREGLPTAIIEALTAGCKVVSTDCPSGPREMLESKQNCRLVPMRNPQAMAQAIIETIELDVDVNRNDLHEYHSKFACRQYINLVDELAIEAML